MLCAGVTYGVLTFYRTAALETRPRGPRFQAKEIVRGRKSTQNTWNLQYMIYIDNSNSLSLRMSEHLQGKPSGEGITLSGP